jgi:NAD(P)H-dependent FMN reductase
MKTIGQHFAVVCGSHHPGSQSEKVARYFGSRLTALNPSNSIFMLPLADAALPLWTSDAHEGSAGTAWDEISQQLHQSDGVVLVTPEWGGMVPAALKNFLLYCDGHELAHKPGLIVAVSSGQNGAYPVAELRMSAGKNTRLCFIPDHVIVRQVDDVLNSDDATDESDASLRVRIDHSVRLLVAYADALRAVRALAAPELDRYRYGM